MNNCKKCGCEDATFTVATKKGYSLRCESCIGVLRPLTIGKKLLPRFEIYEKEVNGNITVDIRVKE